MKFEKSVNVKLTEKDYNTIKEIADSSGISMSAVIRNAISKAYYSETAVYKSICEIKCGGKNLTCKDCENLIVDSISKSGKRGSGICTVKELLGIYPKGKPFSWSACKYFNPRTSELKIGEGGKTNLDKISKILEMERK
jgi:hypothetical protein